MPSFTFIILRLLHFFHSFCVLVASFCRRLRQPPPSPLTATRRRVPKHLSVIFTKWTYIEPEAEEERLLSTVESVIAWSRLVGVEQITFYDRAGMNSVAFLHDHS